MLLVKLESGWEWFPLWWWLWFGCWWAEGKSRVKSSIFRSHFSNVSRILEDL